MDQDHRYQEALSWIHGLSRFGIKPGLERMEAMLGLLGNPHRLVKYVHIAGTNGKGSTAAILAAVLSAGGYRIGLYTSPYLLSFTNRMAINGCDIKKTELSDLVDLIRPVVEEVSSDQRYGQSTEFEVVTVLALTYFASLKVDLVVLEVGLGGRLDATNVVTPLLSIITNIDLEHTEVLGDTLEEIAFEKAGIIKEGVPILTASEDPIVLSVIKNKADENNAELYSLFFSFQNGYQADKANKPVINGFAISSQGQSFSYNGFNTSYQDLFIPLRGRYQVYNAATALAALELIAGQGFKVDEKVIRKGLAEVIWPGRLELLNDNPLLVMDGAHNPAAMQKMAQAIPEYFNFERLILVFGIMADKDAVAMMSAILPLAEKVYFTRASIPRAADPNQLHAIALTRFQLNRDLMEIEEDIGNALGKALKEASPDDLVLVTGSFYTVSDARAYWSRVI